ncbi:MAG: 30S ribosomal protein S16 [Prolixibacteraceae bacterium]|nr:30S ribosomal protein S16 [Prolixibacteraceae bacterium]
MPVKIRLARHGRKRNAYYHIVVADSRAPRDGRFIERIGSYNPITNPATIELDFDKALSWLTKGAQPTETAKAILSYQGVLMKKHLLDGVKKGAFDEAEAERRYAAWKQEKEAKIQAKVDKLAKDADSELESRLKAEAKIKEARAAELAKKNSALKEEVKSVKAEAEPEAEKVKEEAPKTEAVTEPVKEEVPVAEEKAEPEIAEEKVEAPVVEKAKEEASKAEDKTEPAAEEVKEETPVGEENSEEAPAEEDKKEEKAE